MATRCKRWRIGEKREEFTESNWDYGEFTFQVPVTEQEAFDSAFGMPRDSPEFPEEPKRVSEGRKGVRVKERGAECRDDWPETTGRKTLVKHHPIFTAGFRR